MDGQVSGRIKYRAVVWLCVLTIIAVAGAAFSGCGWMFKGYDSSMENMVVQIFSSFTVEPEIVLSIAGSAAVECKGINPLDASTPIQVMQISMKDWKLFVLDRDGHIRSDSLAVTFVNTTLTFGDDSSVWKIDPVTWNLVSDTESEYSRSISVPSPDSQNTRYINYYCHRARLWPNLDSLTSDSDSTASLVTSPVLVEIAAMDPWPRRKVCGTYVGHFRATKFGLVQDSIVKVKDSE